MDLVRKLEGLVASMCNLVVGRERACGESVVVIVGQRTEGPREYDPRRSILVVMLGRGKVEGGRM